MSLTAKQETEIAEYLEGTCKSVAQVFDAFDFDCAEDDVYEAVLNNGIEECTGCNWWFETCELIPDPDEEGSALELHGLCGDCRKVKS